MITISAVNYGDILPSSDSERIYGICEMTLGCGYSRFVLGNMASIISTKDQHLRACWARVEDAYAWIDHHQFIGRNKCHTPSRRVIRPEQKCTKKGDGISEET